MGIIIQAASDLDKTINECENIYTFIEYAGLQKCAHCSCTEKTQNHLTDRLVLFVCKVAYDFENYIALAL